MCDVCAGSAITEEHKSVNRTAKLLMRIFFVLLPGLDSQTGEGGWGRGVFRWRVVIEYGHSLDVRAKSLLKSSSSVASTRTVLKMTQTAMVGLGGSLTFNIAGIC